MDAKCIGCTLFTVENAKATYGEMKAWEYHIKELKIVEGGSKCQA